jgi:hypothetical protein
MYRQALSIIRAGVLATASSVLAAADEQRVRDLEQTARRSIE